MTIKLYALTCGWLTLRLGALLEGQKGSLRVPIPCYLIEHPKGRVLFDSGLHASLQEDPAARLGDTARFVTVHYAPGEELAGRLARLDLEPRDVQYLVNSHLHFDHTGGNEAASDATLVVQRREWEAGHDPDLVTSNGYMPQDYDHGHRLKLVDGEHDLFGDGSIVCVPTYGHTPGHQSLKVRLPTGDVVLTGDACYLRKTLEDLHLPFIVHDRAAMLESLHRLRRLRDAGARIFYGHDPEFWQDMPQAPQPVA
jgi:glyoxylase-like metal-dependent hydrolase (beta-lactamase superfamily II)